MKAFRNIAHFDLDSFFVSVECLKNSKLKGRPIAIGGLSDPGVFASCSYEARRFDVKSAMPVRLAKRLEMGLIDFLVCNVFELADDNPNNTYLLMKLKDT